MYFPRYLYILLYNYYLSYLYYYIDWFNLSLFILHCYSIILLLCYNFLCFYSKFWYFWDYCYKNVFLYCSSVLIYDSFRVNYWVNWLIMSGSGTGMTGIVVEGTEWVMLLNYCYSFVSLSVSCWIICYFYFKMVLNCYNSLFNIFI